MPTILVTSANRGIGRECVRRYAGDGWRVLAACRDPARADLDAFGETVVPLAMDVTDDASVQAAAQGDGAIDLMINSAGIMGQMDDTPGNVDFAEFARVLDVNTLGPVRVLDAFLPRLADGATVVTITSGMGSLADAGSGMAMMYRASKAAVNMAMRARSFQLAERGVTIVVINPGWVRTDMGGPSASLSVEDSVRAIRRVIGRLTPNDNGSFLNYSGEAYPW